MFYQNRVKGSVTPTEWARTHTTFVTRYDSSLKRDLIKEELFSEMEEHYRMFQVRVGLLLYHREEVLRLLGRWTPRLTMKEYRRAVARGETSFIQPDLTRYEKRRQQQARNEVETQHAAEQPSHGCEPTNNTPRYNMVDVKADFVAMHVCLEKILERMLWLLGIEVSKDKAVSKYPMSTQAWSPDELREARRWTQSTHTFHDNLIAAFNDPAMPLFMTIWLPLHGILEMWRFCRNQCKPGSQFYHWGLRILRLDGSCGRSKRLKAHCEVVERQIGKAIRVLHQIDREQQEKLAGYDAFETAASDERGVLSPTQPSLPVISEVSHFSRKTETCEAEFLRLSLLSPLIDTEMFAHNQPLMSTSRVESRRNSQNGPKQGTGSGRKSRCKACFVQRMYSYRCHAPDSNWFHGSKQTKAVRKQCCGFCPEKRPC